MVATIKVPLFPTSEQEKRFREFCGTSRFIYNLTLAYKIKCYDEEGCNCKLQDLIEYVQSYKYSEEYKWLQDIPEAVQKQAIKDMLSAYKHFFATGKGFPRYKSKRRSKLSFYQRSDKLHLVDDTHIKITGIKQPVRIHNKYRKTMGYLLQNPLNPRVKFDGKQWYLTFSHDFPEPKVTLTDEVIGVDLGVKNTAILSNGEVYKNINKTKKVKQLEKRKKRLQRKVSRKFEMNKQGEKFVKTKNIAKVQLQIDIIQRKLDNIRNTYIHTITYNLVKAKPSEIVIEDLNVRGMMKNRHLAKAISEQCFYRFRQYLTYKCKYWGIKLTVADRFYPSSKKCSCCGNKKKFLSLSERIYKCDICGFTMDRDLNAAINLRNYALSQ